MVIRYAKLGTAIVAMVCFAAGCKSTVGLIDATLGGLGIEKSKTSDSRTVQEIIRSRIPIVAEQELKRLNYTAESTRIVFVRSQGDPLGGGKYYKERRVYERWYPGEIKPSSRGPKVSAGLNSNNRTTSWSVVIEYRYRTYRGPEKTSREEAAASETVAVDKSSAFERYKYGFDRHGQWDGKPGRLME
ncbi:MAG: hypothetical protein J7M12_03625 [Candidatus Hydrogenedentes bacterium]|nr:hypothetical protein [Candidatus Hydrogenedentota bacterium]